jgi:hypothetical protein
VLGYIKSLLLFVLQLEKEKGIVLVEPACEESLVFDVI